LGSIVKSTDDGSGAHVRKTRSSSQRQIGRSFAICAILGQAELLGEALMDLKTVHIEIPEGCNVIIGQTHFIKTAEDLFEIVATTVPQAKFGIAFTEASGPCLIRTEGNDDGLVKTCVATLQALGAGHVFCIYLRDAFPVNILNQIKNCHEVCRVFCATANPLEVVVASSAQGSGILGVIDGFPPKGVETPADKEQRRGFLRKIGYKL
jgi:adenosine/AMP kinase